MPSTIGPWRSTSAAKAASSREAANRSRSCRSESPAAEPPAKSAPSCRATEVAATCDIPDRSLVVALIEAGATMHPASIHPHAGTVAPPAELSRVYRRLSSSDG